MKLTPEQLERFDREGYLFFPSLFTRQEIKLLTDEVPDRYWYVLPVYGLLVVFAALFAWALVRSLRRDDPPAA